MKKTPKLNIFSGPEAVLHPVLTAHADAIVLSSDTIQMLRLKKSDKVELANQQNNRKKWYIRRNPKAGYGLSIESNGEHTTAVLNNSGEITSVIRKIFEVAKENALVGTISTKEEFNGWFAINFLHVQI